MALRIGCGTALLLLVGAGDALAQEGAGGVTPQVVVIGFEDKPDGRNCDESAARVGRCIEEVEFRDMDDLFTVHLGMQGVPRLRTYARMYSWLWDDISRRFKGDDVVESTLVEAGIKRLPESAKLWDATERMETGTTGQEGGAKIYVYAAPAQDLWLDGSDWVGGSPDTPPLYRSLAYRHPDGLVPPPPLVMLKGRFAERLVYDGRRHQFDFMDGDPESSGPFFEQMYPYEQALASRGSGDGDGGEGDEDEYFPDEYSSGADDWWGVGGGGYGTQVQPAPEPEAPEGDVPLLDDDGFGFSEFGAYHYDSLDDDGGDHTVPTDDIPLSHFVADEALKTRPRGGWTTDAQKAALVEARRDTYAKTLLPLEADIDDLREKAHAEFDNFYENVGTQIVRFAREEYTPTHLRVLTAMMAMHDPPGQLGDSRGLTKDAVAAAEGQLDADSLLMQEAGAAFRPDRSFTLAYKELPKDVVDKRLTTLDLWNRPDDKLLFALTRKLGEDFGPLLRPRVEALRGLDDDSLKAWADDNAKDSRRAAFILKYVYPTALEVIVQRLGEEQGKNERDKIETSLILDHVRYEFVSRFSTEAAVRQTPGELEAMAAEQWVSVLRRHGFYANSIPDGPGAVDPLAICTTLDRAAALEEPVFGIIKVDGLVVAPDGLEDADAILWHARDQLPFLLVDDPGANRPAILRIVSLPGERAIYRVRWTVWSGWHVVWAPEPVSIPDQQYRLALRTTAICDDTVLAPPRIVPTLVRAALLEGAFRPVNAIQGDGTQAVEDYYSKPTNDEIFDASKDQVDTGDQVVDVTTAVAEGDTSMATAQDALALGAKLLKGKQVDTPVESIRKESVKYVRDLVSRPLGKTVSGAAVVVVMDESQPREKRRIHFNKPRAPYLLARAKEGENFRYGAAWAYYLPPPDADPPTRVMLAPAYQPTQSVSSNAMVQKWTRRQTGDWALSAGLGAFPYRRVVSLCTDVGKPDTVADCSVADAEAIAQTGGVTLDVSALRTLWKSSWDRWAIEFGPELHLDVVTRGRSPYDENSVRYPWVIKYMGGFLVGVRFGPAPGPLAVKGDRYPWGADGPDGSSRLQRVEYGFRLGGLLGPSFSGLEGTVFGEGWAGWSLRRKRAKDATFTPYHPSIVLGPYVRASHTRLLAEGEPRYYTLSSATAIYVGARLHFRVNGSGGGGMPEAP